MAKTEGRTYANYVCALAPLALPGVMNIELQNSQYPRTTVAIFHLSVKTISRSAGRSSTAAAAYRAGVEITDEENRRDSRLPAKGRCRICRIVPAGWCARVGDRPGETLERSRAIREAEKFHRRP